MRWKSEWSPFHSKKVAFSIANSPLVKTAIAAEDANWGRIIMAIGKTNEIFNISDDQPASQEEVAVYGALLLKMDKPNPLEMGDLEEGMLKDFYKESKKVDNKKIKNFFNYQFIYPSYKEGLDNIVNDFI